MQPFRLCEAFCGALPRGLLVLRPYRSCGGFAGLRPGTLWFWVFATLWVVRFFWQCLLGGRLGPPFFPAGKESAAGGVKKGGQGGLPMGPLDDPPTANKGGCGPLFWINPPGERGGSAGRMRRYVGRICERLLRGKALRCCPCLLEGWFLGGAVPANTWRGSWFLRQWGLLALLLWQRVASLASCSGEQDRRSSFWERTFVCNQLLVWGLQ